MSDIDIMSAVDSTGGSGGDSTIAGSSTGGGTNSQNSGQGGGMIGGIFQSGADTFTTAVNWLTYGQDKELMDKYRREDMAIAKEARDDALRQQALENRRAGEQFQFNKDQAAEQSKFAREQFDWGKQRFGEEFGFTRQQYRDNLKRQKEQDALALEDREMGKQTMALDRIKNSLNEALGNDIQMKQLVASRLGANSGSRQS